MNMSRSSSLLGILASLAIALGGPASGSAQTEDFLVVRGPDDSSLSLTVRRLRGYATVPHEALSQLGWSVEVEAPRLRAQLGSEGPVVEFSLGSPFFRWDDELLQLVSPPFSGDGSFQIPLQFVVDFLPTWASEAYAFSPEERNLEILDASLWPGPRADRRRVERELDQASRDDPSGNVPASTDNPSTHSGPLAATFPDLQTVMKHRARTSPASRPTFSHQ